MLDENSEALSERGSLCASLGLLELDDLVVSTWTNGPAPTPFSSELLAIAFTVKKQRLLIPYLDVVIESTLPTR